MLPIISLLYKIFAVLSICNKWVSPGANQRPRHRCTLLLVFKKFCVLFSGHSHTQGKPRNSYIIVFNFFLKLPAFLDLPNTSWIGGTPFLVPLATEPRVNHPVISQTLHSCGSSGAQATK